MRSPDRPPLSGYRPFCFRPAFALRAPGFFFRPRRMVYFFYMAGEEQSVQERTNLKVEVLEKVSQLTTAGLGLVAALAWNDAIKGLFESWFPQPGENLWAKLIYALLITILIVVVTVQLGRAVNVAKKQLTRRK